jgi:hypothetical protein
MINPDLITRAQQYAELSSIALDWERPLGHGTDGAVWKSNVDTAVKVLLRERGYYNERDAYLRLQDFGITKQIEGFWIPELVGYCDELCTIEMDFITKAPYILDFAKVRIDRPPGFSEEILQDLNKKGLELFQHHWPKVKCLMASLESIGIYYLDPQLDNIKFPDCNRERALRAKIRGATANRRTVFRDLTARLSSRAPSLPSPWGLRIACPLSRPVRRAACTFLLHRSSNMFRILLDAVVAQHVQAPLK